MCHVYYPVASVLQPPASSWLKACLTENQSTTRGRQDFGFTSASWAAEKFHQGARLFKY